MVRAAHQPQHGLVMPFIHILEHVLDTVDGADNLHVEVAIILQQQARVVGNNHVVVKLDAISDHKATIIWAAPCEIPISIVIHDIQHSAWQNVVKHNTIADTCKHKYSIAT